MEDNNESKTEKIAIKLSEEYYIGFDPCNIILYQAKKSGEKSKEPGKLYFKALGYYGDYETLCKHLLKECLFNDYNKINELKDITLLYERYTEEILKTLKETNPIEKYKN